jgi:hypothetical protein
MKGWNLERLKMEANKTHDSEDAPLLDFKYAMVEGEMGELPHEPLP